MKKTMKINLKHFITFNLLLLSLLNSTGLYAARGEEEGGIGGTGYKNTEERLLRPEIPRQDVRPEIINVPRPAARPMRIERPTMVEQASELLPIPDHDRPESPGRMSITTQK